MTSASGPKRPASSLSPEGLLPDAFQPFIAQFSGMMILNVCSHRKQSFERPIRDVGEGLEAAEAV